LPAGSKCGIILRDLVDSTATGSVVVFDAIRFMNTATTEIFNNNTSTTTSQSAAAFSYPNPFNPSTNILYYLQEKSDVEIIIYNALGIIMKEYTITSQAPGDHSIQWNATSHQGYAIPAGIYIYTINTNLKRLSGKMLFIK
ncbi:MAG: FlgD immunoglobulin-like domain containing protein, partial [Candidatus Marinimicrobia bacterium]|nr:FlgD immunoglobulin-like domain containing protein [Candidatus Neomarinimicrobiota bacterium]